MIKQRTLVSEVSTTGLGIHSGKKVHITLKPAPADYGISFTRVDLEGRPTIKALAENVGATDNNTTLTKNGVSIHTVEHLMSALYGTGVNNCIVEIDAAEVPIMDGSSTSFVFLIKEAGVKNLEAERKFLVIKRAVIVEDNGKWAKIEPSEQLEIDSTIIFAHPQIKMQRKNFVFNCENYLEEISRARTFGFMKDVDMLKRKGLAKGASLDNAIGLDDFKILNPQGLRYKDEFVRHKVLDTIGDVSLLGHDVIGKITTYKSGHYIHNLLCRKILEHSENYEVIEISGVGEKAKESLALPEGLSPVYL